MSLFSQQSAAHRWRSACHHCFDKWILRLHDWEVTCMMRMVRIRVRSTHVVTIRFGSHDDSYEYSPASSSSMICPAPPPFPGWHFEPWFRPLQPWWYWVRLRNVTIRRAKGKGEGEEEEETASQHQAGRFPDEHEILRESASSFLMSKWISGVSDSLTMTAAGLGHGGSWLPSGSLMDFSKWSTRLKKFCFWSVYRPELWWSHSSIVVKKRSEHNLRPEKFMESEHVTATGLWANRCRWSELRLADHATDNPIHLVFLVNFAFSLSVVFNHDSKFFKRTAAGKNFIMAMQYRKLLMTIITHEHRNDLLFFLLL